LSVLSLNDVNIYYQAQGNGVPIVFIHPPLLTSANFTYQIQDLSTTFKTIVFDIRGHGRSSYSNEPLTYSLISNDIIHLLDHLEIEKAFLCGYSTGGTIALDFMITYPERTIGAILLGPMSEVNDWVLKKEISLAVMLSKNKAIETLALAICFGNSNNKKVFWDLYREAIKGNPKNIKQYYQYSMKYNCTAQLDRIKLPVLLIYGKKDKLFHPYAHLINQKLPNNELVFVKNVKHQLPTKAAMEVNQLIKLFMNKL
jgi:pimeloyl-ACP methyl ester carboxylesterase